MRRIAGFFLLVLGVCTNAAQAQTIESMPFSDLQKEIAAHGNKTLVINFWATWCRPCVEELPDFEKFRADHAGGDLEVWLINLDFNSVVETTVKAFVQKRGLQSRIIHLTDTDPNDWIDKVDPAWGGNIPATLIYVNGKRASFHPNPLSYAELVNLTSKK